MPGDSAWSRQAKVQRLELPTFEDLILMGLAWPAVVPGVLNAAASCMRHMPMLRVHDTQLLLAAASARYAAQKLDPPIAPELVSLEGMCTAAVKPLYSSRFHYATESPVRQLGISTKHIAPLQLYSWQRSKLCQLSGVWEGEGRGGIKLGDSSDWVMHQTR